MPWLATWFHKTLQVWIRWGKWDATLSKTDKTKLMGGWWTASWVRDSSDKGFVVVQLRSKSGFIRENIVVRSTDKPGL